MREEGFIGGLILTVAAVFMLWLAPDNLSFFIVMSMCLLVFIGFIGGIRLVLRFSKGLVAGQKKIEKARGIQTEHVWFAMSLEKKIFNQKYLDALFEDYREEAKRIQEWDEEGIICDVEEYINEDQIRSKVWKNLLDLIPGTLTGLGILGTFLGLMLGLGGIAFESLSETMISIQTLLSGMRLAFYSSICGVILSILFNFIFHIIWESMLKELQLFIEQFHRHVIPSPEEQMYKKQSEFQTRLLQVLEGKYT